MSGESGPTPPAASRPRTVLVLGGGGLKGIAHIGALRALDEAGVRPDAIVGTSIGSLIGALAAAGESIDALAERARALHEDDILRVNRRIAWIRGLNQESIYLGERLQDYIRSALPVDAFDELALPLRVNAASLGTGRQVWFGTGARTDIPLADAVYASSALPMYFPPLHANGDFLVDGGVLDALPIEAALRWGAGRVIAVDVSASFQVAAADPWVDHGLVGIHQRVMDILGEKQRRMIPPPDLSRVIMVRPEIGHLGTFEFGRAEFAMERGYAATLAALEAAATAPGDGRVRRLWTRVKDVLRTATPSAGAGPPAPREERSAEEVPAAAPDAVAAAGQPVEGDGGGRA